MQTDLLRVILNSFLLPTRAKRSAPRPLRLPKITLSKQERCTFFTLTQNNYRKTERCAPFALPSRGARRGFPPGIVGLFLEV